MDALVLCGGFATRLEPITFFIPKPLLPVGGRPIIDYIVDDMVDIGVDSLIFSTNRKFADQFEYWINHRKAAKLEGGSIKLVVEPSVHNGEKFGAIKGINYTIDKAGINNDLLVVAGDNFYTFSLAELVSHFNKYRVPTVALYDVKSLEEAKKLGVVSVQGDKVVSFEEKPEKPKSTLISTGIYIFPKEMLGKFREIY